MLLAIGLCAATSAVGTARAAERVDAQKIERGYFGPETPSVRIPPCKGERYEDLVPDTLELSEMARLAVNGLTGPLDPAAGYELYFEVDWFRNPPVMIHDFSDWCGLKFLGPLVLMRIICGSDHNMDVQQKSMECYLRSIGPDGLFHAPKAGRDWQMVHLWDEAKPKTGAPPVEDYGGGAIFSVHSRLIEAAWLYEARDPQGMWERTARQMAATAIRGIADKGEFAYPGGSEKVPTGFLGTDGWIIQALAQHYRATGDERARDLTRKLVCWQKDHAQIFREDGSFVFDRTFQPQRGGAHFHVHSNCLLGFLEYALAAHDDEVLAYVRKSYEWARRQGVPLVGFFPETVRPDCSNSEGCPVSDMVALAVKLSEGGVADYWDDVDRWVRNYFSELQLTPEKAAYLERLAKLQPAKAVASNETADRVTERNIGAFAGWPTANDWMRTRGIQHCCTGNCARAIYYVWQGVLGYRDGRLAVNLLLNRASPWADVYSCIPYEGRVELRIKRDLADLDCRMPEWIESGSKEVHCEANGAARRIGWNERYVRLGPVKRGDRVVLTFPVSERTVKSRIGGLDCTLVIKGSTVVAIDPAGRNCPLYQRARFRADRTPWHTVSRFVSQESIHW